MRVWEWWIASGLIKAASFRSILTRSSPIRSVDIRSDMSLFDECRDCVDAEEEQKSRRRKRPCSKIYISSAVLEMKILKSKKRSRENSASHQIPDSVAPII